MLQYQSMRQHGDKTNDGTQRVTVVQAAELLGLTEGAVRQRLKRGTLASEMDTDGSVYVLLERTHARTNADNTRTNADNTNDNTNDHPLSHVVELLEDQVQYLRIQLDAEREANRENRRLLAAALERIPELEPARESPPGPREEPETASPETEGVETPIAAEEKPVSSWWRRLFGEKGEL